MNERITIILLTKNRHGFFYQAFSSLLAQSHKEWDCIVIDDSDTPIEIREETRFLLAIAKIKYNNVRFIYGENLGIAQAWQRGMEASETELCYRMEDDIWLEPDNLGLLYNVIIKDPMIAAVGGMMPNALNPPILKGHDLYSYFFKDSEDNLIPDDMQRYLPDNRFPKNTLFEVQHLHGLFLFRKEAIQRVGGFGIHMSSVAHRDETDVCLRLWFQGYKLIVYPRALHYHAEAKSGGSRSFSNNLERTTLQRADEILFQARVREWQERHPEKKLKIINS